MNNKVNVKNKHALVKEQVLPLVPGWLLVPLWVISLCLPNIIYSGIKFADTLHILKWTITGVPVAIAVIIAGVRLFIYGRERIKFKLDIFAVIYAVILVYCALQPLWVKIFSPTGYVLEMVCFVTVWAFYVISVNSFPEGALRPIIVLANINAAFNVLFAELQSHNMNDLKFLDGTIFADLQRFSSIILPTPGNYIGNTAQQNMFGLWISIAVLGAVYLYAYDVWKNAPEDGVKVVWVPACFVALGVFFARMALSQSSIIFAVIAALCILGAFGAVFYLKGRWHNYFSVIMLLFLVISTYGVLRSTSRSASYSLIGGLILMAVIGAWKFNRKYVHRLLACALVICCVFWLVQYLDSDRGGIIAKTVDVVENFKDIGLRRGIWTTSYAMLLEHPEGVGIGQYKWHYIEGQRAGFRMFPYDWYDWQYTHWAHNEYLQFFCEGGYIGGILFVSMFLTSFICAFIGIFRKKEINKAAVWGFSLSALISFCALFTRPYHRIENIVWILLAFAMSNKEFFPAMRFKTSFEPIKSNLFAKFVSIACVAASIAGCVYISSGICGNYLLRQALSTSNAKVQLYLLNEANKHPIVREDTQRNLGYHYLQLGEQTEDRQALIEGFNILWAQFQREPHSEDISRLINFAQRYQLTDVLKEIKSYFKPGTYHLQRVPQTDSNGNVVNALLMLNGPGSDDE